MTDKFKKLENHEEIMPLVKELEALEEEIMVHEKPLSFNKFSPEVRERYLRAADYADLFVEVQQASGVVVAAMAAYYLCRCKNGAEKPCNTIILSKKWTRKYQDDPLKSGQCWYGNICGTRFQTNFGMLIEIFSEEDIYYMRAPVKPFDVLDLVGLKLEDTLDGKTPLELYDALPTKNIRETEVIRKAMEVDFWRKSEKKDLEGVYKVDNEFYKKLTAWNWYDIFTFTNWNPITNEKYSKGGKSKKPSGYNRKIEEIFKTRRLMVEHEEVEGGESEHEEDEGGESDAKRSKKK
jgi:hypothetical protein